MPTSLVFFVVQQDGNTELECTVDQNGKTELVYAIQQDAATV
jgi:hypothetical protein